MQYKIFVALLILLSYTSYSIKCGSNHHNLSKKNENKLLISDHLQTFLDTPEGNFRVHFDTIGENAVSPLDLNQNKIPDFIDSVLFYAEDVRKFYIDLGWKMPPLDQNPNSSKEKYNGGSPAYDIYIEDIGERVYGATGSLHTFNIDGVEVVSSRIVINNEFGENFETTGYEAIKVTLAHEFHHAIQYSYPFALNTRVDLLTFEITSTFFESQYLQGNTDFFQYLRVLFSEPKLHGFSHVSGNIISVYAYSIYMQYLNKQFDSDIIMEIWEHPSGNIFTTLKDILQKYGTTPEESWEEFLVWCYYTGERALPEFGFDNAETWPEVEFEFQDTLNIDPESNASRIKNLSFTAKRVISPTLPDRSPDTLDIFITRNSFDNIYYDDDEDYAFQHTVANFQFNSSNRVLETDYFDFISADDNFDLLYFFKPGKQLSKIGTSFPNPFNREDYSAINFPVADDANIYETADLIIYSENLEPLKRFRIKISLLGDLKVVQVEFAQLSLSSGVYFFRTVLNDKQVFGKFVVL